MTPEQAQAVRDVIVGTIEMEAVTTRKVIAAVPNNRRDYKPDDRSRTAWDIATHIATSEVWFGNSIADGAFVWSGEGAIPAEMTDPAAVVAWHEKHLAQAIARLRAMSGEQLLKPIEFFGRSLAGAFILPTMNNHTIHHRGQLAAYLRAMGSKVPALYGMSADEPMTMA